MTDAFELADQLEKASKEVHEQALRDAVKGLTFNTETLEEFVFRFIYQIGPGYTPNNIRIELVPRTPAAKLLEDTLRPLLKKSKGRDLLRAEFFDLPSEMQQFYFGKDGHFHWIGSLHELERMLSFVGGQRITVTDAAKFDEVLSKLAEEHRKRQKAADQVKTALGSLLAAVAPIHVWEGGRP